MRSVIARSEATRQSPTIEAQLAGECRVALLLAMTVEVAPREITNADHRGRTPFPRRSQPGSAVGSGGAVRHHAALAAGGCEPRCGRSGIALAPHRRPGGGA